MRLKNIAIGLHRLQLGCSTVQSRFAVWGPSTLPSGTIQLGPSKQFQTKWYSPKYIFFIFINKFAQSANTLMDWKNCNVVTCLLQENTPLNWIDYRIKIRLSKQTQILTFVPFHCEFLEYWNTQKSVWRIWQHFSCLLGEGFPNIWNKLNSHGDFLRAD